MSVPNSRDKHFTSSFCDPKKQDTVIRISQNGTENILSTKGYMIADVIEGLTL